MNARAYASAYKDQPAVTLENDTIAAQFLPGTGAKMCSLVYKPAGAELLVQRPAPAYRTAAYAGDYVAEGECSGFDEMFPSIDRCFYENYPWRGTEIPDHGEVWSLPWSYAIDAEVLHFSVHGVRFPYRLEKSIAFTPEGALRSAYQLSNLSPFDFDFMWAAHMMLNLQEGAQLTLPAGVRQVVTALRFGGSLGEYGDIHDWPVAATPAGGRRDLSRLQPKAAGDVVKYFVKGRLPDGLCSLTYPDGGFTLRLAFPVEQVPYLAILPNEGGWQDLYNVFLEPATAAFDRLDVARVRGECSTVKAEATCSWWLDIVLEAS